MNIQGQAALVTGGASGLGEATARELARLGAKVAVLDLNAALAEKGIEPERAPYSVREGGSLLCFVRDPDGYRIELIERSDY